MFGVCGLGALLSSLFGFLGLLECQRRFVPFLQLRWLQSHAMSSAGLQQRVGAVAESTLSEHLYSVLVSTMIPTQPHVVRGIPLRQLLRHFPSYWWRGKLGHLHRHSVQVAEFDEFWSHAWSAPACPKIANVLLLHHGFLGILGNNFSFWGT